MNKKSTIIVVAALVIVLFASWVVPAEELHQHYDVSNVKSMKLWGIGLNEGFDGRLVNDQEKKQIIQWLNESEDVISHNPNPTTSAQAGIDIVFDNGEGMVVFPSGELLLVQRYTEIGWETSFLKNDNLLDLLKKMSNYANK